MQAKKVKLTNLQAGELDFGRKSAKLNISEVFAERQNQYLTELTLFTAHFNSIPNFIQEINIDCKKSNNWYVETYWDEIKFPIKRGLFFHYYLFLHDLRILNIDFCFNAFAQLTNSTDR